MKTALRRQGEGNHGVRPGVSAPERRELLQEQLGVQVAKAGWTQAAVRLLTSGQGVGDFQLQTGPAIGEGGDSQQARNMYGV